MSCWTIAEHAGEATADGMQHLLARAVWDTDGVAENLCEYVVEHLADPDAVLVIDETGDGEEGQPHGRCAAGSTPAPPGGSRTPRSRSI